MANRKAAGAASHTFQAPTGTRDLYPEDLLRRRFVEKLWRDTAVRHGFDEIDGPTFEHLDLYTVKSGEGIVSELFSFKRAGGEKDYALRPEFTPTLARMYAARAGSLPKPTKWFMAGPFFRAEKPQRGRLREFWQWNVDCIGGGEDPQARADADAEVLACCVALAESAGLSRGEVQVHINDRWFLTDLLKSLGIPEAQSSAAFDILDQVGKRPETALRELAAQRGVATDGFLELLGSHLQPVNLHGRTELVGFGAYFDRFAPLKDRLADRAGWFRVNMMIARGLAYYTGTVFEAVASGERAVCGGGRYDNLIELFGGPPTPAVGFGMGDVVLSLVLQDKGLMPDGPALLDALSRPGASLRPDVFVIPTDRPEAVERVRSVVADLRRGRESEAYLSRGGRKPWDADRYDPCSGGRAPLHARHSYKATKNIGKLLQEASATRARFAAIVESSETATLKNLDTGEQRQDVPLADVARLVTP